MIDKSNLNEEKNYKNYKKNLDALLKKITYKKMTVKLYLLN